MNDGLKDSHRAAVIGVIAANERVERALLFGSRATETHTVTSDIDIVLFGDRLTLTDQAKLVAAAEELAIPQRVDFLLHTMIDSDTLRKHIERDGVEWYRRASRQEARRLRLSPKRWGVIEALLGEHLPGVEVWAYGRRATGSSHDGSSLDLVLRGPGLQEIPPGKVADFEEAVRDSMLPSQVEACDWARLPERFQREIERGYVIVQKGETQAGIGAWPEVTLGDFAPFTYGKGLRTDDRIPSGGVPVIGSNGIIGYHDTPLTDGPTIVIGRKGTVGAVRYSPVPCWPIDTTFFVTGDDPDLLKFRYYTLKTLPLQEMNSDSAVPGLNRDDAHACLVRVPEEAEQRAIAHVLGTLDDKIELNRRMNETLEAIARAIFKDWFIDFGPTRAKADGRASYLAAELWDLFPNALDSEDKPNGWKQGALADIAHSPRRGVSPADVAEDTPYIGLEHMPRRSVALTEWEGAGKVTSNKSAFKRGEFLVGKLRPYFHKVGLAPLDGICSTDIAVVTARAPDWAAFTLLCLFSDEFVDYMDQTSTGTKMPRTSWKTMGQYPICLPSNTVSRAFQNLVQPILNHISANIREARDLAEARDLLLPKLMSAKIRLRAAEKAVEAVA